MVRSWPLVAGLVSAAVILVSCGGAGRPAGTGPVVKPKLPVATSFRNSLVGRGKVLVLSNTSGDTLPEVWVKVRTGKWGDTSEVMREVARDLGPGRSAEVGWAELGGWRLAPGEWVEVWCSGGKEYERVTVRVPEKTTD